MNRRRDRRYAALGQMVDIGGGRLHIHCTRQCRPVVILEAGSGGDFSSLDARAARSGAVHHGVLL